MFLIFTFGAGYEGREIQDKRRQFFELTAFVIE